MSTIKYQVSKNYAKKVGEVGDFWQNLTTLISNKRQQKNYWVAIKEFSNFLGAKSINTLKSENKLLSATFVQAGAYMKWQELQSGGFCSVKHHNRANLRSHNTISNRYNVLHHIYSFLLSKGFIGQNPFAYLSPPPINVGLKQPTNDITLDQAKLMINLCPDTVKGRKELAVLAVMLGAGLRRSEVTKIRICDVYDTGIFLGATKTKSDYRQEVNLKLFQHVLNWRDFRLSEGAKETDSLYQISDSTVRWIVKRYSQKAGIKENISCHSLRATYATQMLEKDVPMETVSTMMRHKYTQSTRVYDKRKFVGDKNPANLIDY